MPFVPQSRSQLRDALLAFLQARYRAIGEAISIAPGTPAYREYDALCVLFEGTQVAAQEATKEIFPDTASDDGVAHHGEVDGVPRKPATAAVLRVSITGTVGATVTFGTSTLNRADGAAYTVSASATAPVGSVVLVGGVATIYATAQVAGTDGNRETGTLTWSATPVDADPTATILELTTTGADEESFAAWAGRIVARRRDRPGGGNRADWQEWTLRYPAAAEAYVYPLLHGVLGPGTPGCVTVVPLGFAPSDPFSDTPSRVLSSGDADKIRGYIEGDNDLEGNPVADGEQLRPVTMDPDDARVIAPPAGTQNVTIVCEFVGVPVPAWWATSGIQTNGGSSATVLNLNTDLTVPPAAVHGDWLAVENPAYRGGYEYAQIDSVGPTSVTLVTPLTTGPSAGREVIAATQYSRDVAGAILGVFDRLGPGEVGGSSARWPPESVIGPATLYRTSLIVAAAGAPGAGVTAGVTGVVSATVTNPGSDVTPLGTVLLVPGAIRVAVEPG